MKIAVILILTATALGLAACDNRKDMDRPLATPTPTPGMTPASIP